MYAHDYRFSNIPCYLRQISSNMAPLHTATDPFSKEAITPVTITTRPILVIMKAFLIECIAWRHFEEKDTWFSWFSFFVDTSRSISCRANDLHCDERLRLGNVCYIQADVTNTCILEMTMIVCFFPQQHNKSHLSVHHHWYAVQKTGEDDVPPHWWTRTAAVAIETTCKQW